MLTFAASAALAVTVSEVPNPRNHGGWVTDLADILPPDAEARLDAVAEALYRELDAEVAIVTVTSADSPSPKEFATTLFNRWGIGDEQADNGLLVLMVLDQRRIEMETGYGLEPVLPDAWLGAIQVDRMVPAFKAGDYAKGLETGIAAIDLRMRQHPDDVRLGTAGPIAVAGAEARERLLLGGAVGGGGLTGLLILIGGVSSVTRRRQRTCDQCRVYMPRLDELADDAHLEPGQRTEEQVGSVDWRVHLCPKCGAVRTFPRIRWFSGYKHCDACGHRTRSSESRTEVAATYHSTGLVRIFERCSHCSYAASYTRSTPMLTHTSSSSSSGGGGGGGSFGGGSSGGGGAGSSW